MVGGGGGDPRQICVNVEKDWKGELWQSGGWRKGKMLLTRGGEDGKS